MDYNLTKHHSLEFDYHYSHLSAAPDLLNNRDATFPVAPFNTSIGTQLSNRNLFRHRGALEHRLQHEQ